MEKINYDNFNDLQSKEINNFNNKYKNILKDMGYDSIENLLFHTIDILSKYSSEFKYINLKFNKYGKEVYEDFLKNLYLMIMAFKMERNRKFKDYNCYNLNDKNPYDIKLFLKDNKNELELFRLTYDLKNNKEKFDLVFYDDQTNFEIGKEERELAIFNRTVKSHNSRMRNAYLSGFSVSHNYYSIETLANLLDDKYRKFYSDDDKCNLLVRRKQIIRDALIELDCYDTYVHDVGTKFEHEKTLIKSYPWLNVYSKTK